MTRHVNAVDIIECSGEAGLAPTVINNNLRRDEARLARSLPRPALRFNYILEVIRRSSIIICAVLILAINGSAQELPRGEIIEKVICRADATQSYALYLPSRYSPDRRWPILYGFDPGGRGQSPVARFKEAAEKYGYIVVGSHNSRNGPDVPLSKIVAALWADTHERLALDERRAYATGFSGGARLAVSVGYAYKLAGVIGCGAGFPPNLTPSKETPFVYFGIVGIEDFNYPELKQLNQTLDSTSVAHQLAVFAGDHAWPPTENCTEAIEWMELRALRLGWIKDDGWIAAWWEKGLAKAREYEDISDVYRAGLQYASLAKDFDGLRDTAAAVTKAQQLNASKEYQRSARAEQNQELQQQLQAREFYSLLERLNNPDDRDRTQTALKDLIARLKRQADDQKRVDERIVARRLSQQFFIACLEESQRDAYQKQYLSAATRLAIAAEIRPENVALLVRLAQIYVQARDKRRAIDALKRAVRQGFSNVKLIEESREFDSLRDDIDFKKVLEEIRAKGQTTREREDGLERCG
jgi:dienelactone hydrolase